MQVDDTDKKNIGLFFQLQQNLSVMGHCLETIKTSSGYKTIHSRLEMVRTNSEELKRNKIFLKSFSEQTLDEFLNYITLALKNLEAARDGEDGVNKQHPAFKYYIHNATMMFQNLKAKFEAVGEKLKE
jgi:hypothetical protein